MVRRLRWLTVLMLTSAQGLTARAANIVYNPGHSAGGAPNGTLAVSATAYWLNGATPTGFANGDNITFGALVNNTSPYLVTINIPGNVNPASTTINVADKALYLLTGSGRLGGTFQSTSGSVFIQNSNSFTSASIGGFVQVRNSSALGTGPVSMAGGLATLDFSFGDGIGGTLNTGNLTLGGGVLGLRIYSAASYSQLNVSGTVSLTNDTVTNLQLDLFYDPVDYADVLTIVANNASDAVTGTGRLSYNNVELGQNAVFTVNSGMFTQEFVISYSGGTGNDITLRAIPEPTTALLMPAGLIGLSCVRLRRRATA